MRQDTRSESDLLIQITFGEAISTEFEFRRGSIAQVGVEDAQGIKVGDMMTLDLVEVAPTAFNVHYDVYGAFCLL